MPYKNIKDQIEANKRYRHKIKEELAYLRKLAQAQPIEEPDKAKIKWRKRTYVLPRGKTTGKAKSPNRPPKEAYYEVLKASERNLCVCELCNSDYRITIHHRDGNPFDNSEGNLQVLCWHCHELFHTPTEEGVHDELEGTKADIDMLDDAETRKFLGIIDEESD